MKCLQNQESLSFSPISSLKNGLFSCDDDGHNTNVHIDHQQNSYYEISLPPPPPPPPPPSPQVIDHDGSKEEEFQFCLSFNSSLALPNFPISTSNRPYLLPEPPTTAFSTIATSQTVNKRYNHHNNNNNSVVRRVSSPRYHQGSFSPYVSRTSFAGQRVIQLRTLDKNQRELIRNRNSGSSGGLRKFMVKLRPIKSMLWYARSRPSPINKPKKTSMDHKPFDPRYMAAQSNDNDNTDKTKLSRTMNFNGLNKMFNIVTKNISRITRKSKKSGSKSCPVSIKSSPIQSCGIWNTGDEGRNSSCSRDHFIQAAIAHCKKSFGK